MKLSIFFAVTSCLLALSNATDISISGTTKVNYKVDDYKCHNTPTMEGSKLEVLVTQGPAHAATFYSSPNCKGKGKTYYNHGGKWQRA
ncbi:hypothetical protein GGI21_002149, partial [Coemansia aciculifera]